MLTTTLSTSRLAQVGVVLVGVAGAGFALTRLPSSASNEPERPVWAGAIGAVASDAAVEPLRQTSASYISPVAIQVAANDHAGRGCSSDSSCAPRPINRIALPPRRPVASTPSVVAVAAPTAENHVGATRLLDRLPSASGLLRPFVKVGDTVSGLIRRL